ncbi:electron transport complex subunit E [Pasteurella testudinis]|uniref:electron transport complex subunit E n=1 Tax=Pasteurella testudinis TaxID=761 RepID=UPI004058C05C
MSEITTNSRIGEIEITEIPQQPPVKPTDWQGIFRQGLWDNNSTLVQLLGLCPLLAVSNSVTHALGLGLATMLVLICTNSIVSLCRRAIPHEIRIPIYVMIIAATVTAVQLLMNAFVYDLYLALGIFIPLIVTNCIVIGRAEAFASKNGVLPSMFDGFSMGLGMTCSLFVLGAMREILGNGTLFAGMEQLFGAWAKSLKIEILHIDTSFLLAILPPGAFIGLGIMLAVKNLIDDKKNKKGKSAV